MNIIAVEILVVFALFVANGAYAKFDDQELRPSEFVAAFLDQCRSESLPLDFFSWHC